MPILGRLIVDLADDVAALLDPHFLHLQRRRVLGVWALGVDLLKASGTAQHCH